MTYSTISTCSTYFCRVLSVFRAHSFRVIPHWIAPLPPPSIDFDDSPPTYKEVATAVNRCRRSSSACPLDQISIIILQKCAFLRSLLHAIIMECWKQRHIPSCWKRSATILIYKKGDTSDPSNFRPITLQPVLYKIMATILRKRMFDFLDQNKLIDKKFQKGFWSSVNGVGEHTESLTHVIRDSKRHQRGLVITLLDLKNAFGEVHHDLIRAALQYHHLPDIVTRLFNSIYQGSATAVTSNKEWTNFLEVKKGVLQGDPSSPLLFNLCFNLLMQVLAKPEFKSLGYIWGPKQATFETSWLQFADDAAIISNSTRDTQQLLDIFVAWCEWSRMTIRLDKCITFGMTKMDNTFAQYQPALFIKNEKIPAVPSGESFVYLGKIFDFDLNNDKAKSKVSEKLNTLLRVTSGLNISVQMKLQILRRFIPTRLSFDLRLYNFGATWIDQHLDSACYEHMRKWLKLPISSCIREISVIPKSKCGLGIPSFKEIYERLWVGKRHKLMRSKHPDIQQIWRETSHLHPTSDNLISNNDTASTALSNLRTSQEEIALTHIFSLKIQGQAQRIIIDIIPRANINSWAAVLESMPQHMFNFARKALIQQLPTAANLFRWKKIDKPDCCLCNKIQTNKHVLANCSSVGSLERYTRRHNNVLQLLAEWFTTVISADQSLYVDIPSERWNSVEKIFQPSCRPDLVVVDKTKIGILELTVCHETNLEKSKQYKLDKYKNIRDQIQPHLIKYTVEIFSLEVSTLGFISDCSTFHKSMKLPKFSKLLVHSIIKSALTDSYSIYCNRNTA